MEEAGTGYGADVAPSPSRYQSVGPPLASVDLLSGPAVVLAVTIWMVLAIAVLAIIAGQPL